MMKRKVSFLLLAVVWILAACAQAVSTSPTPGAKQETPVGQADTPVQATPAQETPGTGERTAVNAAIAALVQEMNVDANQVKIIDVQAVEWPNACLGAQKPDEMCAEMITPGYKITLQAGEKTVAFHTNEDGSQIRRVDDGLVAGPKGPTESAGSGETPTANFPPAANAARVALAKQAGLMLNQVRVVRAEPMEWPDGCLGIERPGVMCTQAIVPGYRVILEAAGKQYEFRTDEGGSTVVAAAEPVTPPLPQVSGKVVIWEQTENNTCRRAEISQQIVMFGDCGGTLQEKPLAAERLEELNFFLTSYGEFSQDTGTGMVAFNGAGTRNANDAEIRSVAEWAALVFAEAQSGQVDESAGLAFNWHREGGFAGFCDDMTVYRSGWALARSCKGSQGHAGEMYRLSPSELENLYAWIDQLKGFDYEHKDSATADAMLVRLSMIADGTQQPTPKQQEEIAGFAAGIYANAANR